MPNVETWHAGALLVRECCPYIFHLIKSIQNPPYIKVHDPTPLSERCGLGISVIAANDLAGAAGESISLRQGCLVVNTDRPDSVPKRALKTLRPCHLVMILQLFLWVHESKLCVCC